MLIINNNKCLEHLWHQIKVPCLDKPEEMVSFRKLLLNRCQHEFEKDKEEELGIEKLQKVIDETQLVRIFVKKWNSLLQHVYISSKVMENAT